MNCPTYYPAYPYRIRPQMSYYDYQCPPQCPPQCPLQCPPQCMPNSCDTNTDCSNNNLCDISNVINCNNVCNTPPPDHEQECDSIPLHMAIDDDNTVLTEPNCNENTPEPSCDATKNVYVIKIPKQGKVRIKS